MSVPHEYSFILSASLLQRSVLWLVNSNCYWYQEALRIIVTMILLHLWKTFQCNNYWKPVVKLGSHLLNHCAIIISVLKL